MIISDDNLDLANALRAQVQDRTETVSDGEGVAMILLWGFFEDHAKYDNMDVETLARNQFEAFLDYARNNVALVRQH